jgi:hypothetical protein
MTADRHDERRIRGYYDGDSYSRRDRVFLPPTESLDGLSMREVCELCESIDKRFRHP